MLSIECAGKGLSGYKSSAENFILNNGTIDNNRWSGSLALKKGKSDLMFHCLVGKKHEQEEENITARLKTSCRKLKQGLSST